MLFFSLLLSFGFINEMPTKIEKVVASNSLVVEKPLPEAKSRSFKEGITIAFTTDLDHSADAYASAKADADQLRLRLKEGLRLVRHSLEFWRPYRYTEPRQNCMWLFYINHLARYGYQSQPL